MSILNIKKELEGQVSKLDALINQNRRETVVSNIFGGGWLARHDPEELDRRQRMMSDYEVDSDNEDWSIN